MFKKEYLITYITENLKNNPEPGSRFPKTYSNEITMLSVPFVKLKVYNN